MPPPLERRAYLAKAAPAGHMRPTNLRLGNLHEARRVQKVELAGAGALHFRQSTDALRHPRLSPPGVAWHRGASFSAR